MDGLLLDTERVALAAFEHTAHELGLSDLAPLGRGLIGLRSDAVKNRLNAALAGRMNTKTFGDAWDKRFHREISEGVPLKPGVTELLGLLQERALPCAVATSTHTDNALRHLDEAGILHLFQTVTGGDQVKHGKPAPDIYHKAAASLGLTAPDCVAFEDSDPGAQAAIASGATTVQVPDINPPAPAMLKNGHLIATTLLDGARKLGLCS